MEYMEAGLSFPHNRDIDGKIILVLKSKLHIRGARDNEQLFRIFIYWMERLNRYALKIIFRFSYKRNDGIVATELPI